MKTDIQHISSGEDEVIVRYREKTPKIKRILDAIGTDDVKIYGKAGDETVCLVLDDILYIETVDDKTFAYTADDVVRLDGSLARIAAKGAVIKQDRRYHDKRRTYNHFQDLRL